MKKREAQYNGREKTRHPFRWFHVDNSFYCLICRQSPLFLYSSFMFVCVEPESIAWWFFEGVRKGTQSYKCEAMTAPSIEFNIIEGRERERRIVNWQVCDGFWKLPELSSPINRDFVKRKRKSLSLPIN